MDVPFVFCFFSISINIIHIIDVDYVPGQWFVPVALVTGLTSTKGWEGLQLSFWTQTVWSIHASSPPPSPPLPPLPPPSYPITHFVPRSLFFFLPCQGQLSVRNHLCCGLGLNDQRANTTRGWLVHYNNHNKQRCCRRAGIEVKGLGEQETEDG